VSTPDAEDLAERLTVELAPYDPDKAEEALEALAEFLVSAYLRRRAKKRAEAQNDRVAG